MKIQYVKIFNPIRIVATLVVLAMYIALGLYAQAFAFLLGGVRWSLEARVGPPRIRVVNRQKEACKWLDILP